LVIVVVVFHVYNVQVAKICSTFTDIQVENRLLLLSFDARV